MLCVSLIFALVSDAEKLNLLQTRFAFARIVAPTGSSITDLIPPLMVNLLAHSEPSELADFMNFIGLLVHRLKVSECRLSEIMLTLLNSGRHVPSPGRACIAVNRPHFSTTGTACERDR
jgi:hypothetical protein